ncbi:phthiotriol/phenolphthiotriol dimycocerosates methyltransferase [Cellulomonas aerilata]|uniref:Phthiotriol/phenolphthiotriol dimycocerosates methyltransferase n=1 Tax=Cellulomonas aerilata TaxID=515326 RepID=A0A512D9R4_9CELL|nr:phthiotriol/phenolphthiotriol dimycocerosates methyltransferase [Cellulomonas aerilata]
MTPGRLAWRLCYELLAAQVRRPEWRFMNYGLSPDALDPPGPAVALDPRDEPDRLCIQLYAHTVHGVPLEGRDVLEVGCGRGGGTEYLARYGGPRSTTGLDFSRSAVALCRRHRRAPGLRFVWGDAQAMPFPDASFDVVVNVESSHCYPSMELFLAEVRRVLRPGGTFAWADLRRADAVPRVRRQLGAAGLTVVSEQDITAGVARALRLDDARKAALVQAWIPRPFRRAIRPFAALEGTPNHTGLTGGDMRYLSARLVAAGPTNG